MIFVRAQKILELNDAIQLLEQLAKTMIDRAKTSITKVDRHRRYGKAMGFVKASELLENILEKECQC